VTYGYSECLRKGRVRKSCCASSPDRPWFDGLAKGLITQHIEIEHSSRFHQRFRFLALVTSENTFPGVSPATVYREKSPFFGRDFSLRPAGFC
jgi:hypothetical protein